MVAGDAKYDLQTTRIAGSSRAQDVNDVDLLSIRISWSGPIAT